jgi:beta-phosphoglucomutase-like phosphatase (HAD superfamily)
MADNEAGGNGEEKTVVQKAMLFELENVAVPGHQIVYDVIKSVLADKGVDLKPMMFSRYCLEARVEEFVPVLLQQAGKTRVSESKLIDEIVQGVRLSFTDSGLKLSPNIPKALKVAEGKNAIVGVLSNLDEKSAMQLMGKLGLGEDRITLLCNASEGKTFPSADAWLKLAKTMSVTPSLCAVVATSSMACKTALSAGMRCVVVPNNFTEFEDFGGSDYVLDSLDGGVLEEVFDLMDPS